MRNKGVSLRSMVIPLEDELSRLKRKQFEEEQLILALIERINELEGRVGIK